MSYARLLNSRALGAVLALACVGVANANSLTYSFSVADQKPDWTSNQSLTRFNPSLGTLTSVTYSFTADVSGTVKMANLSMTSSNNLSAALTAKISATLLPNTAPSISLTPTTGYMGGTFAKNTSHTPTYSGPSGATYKDLFSSTTASQTLTDTAWLNYFTGTSAINFTLAATDLSGYKEFTANTKYVFTTLAGASGYVTYNYAPTVQATPEPCTMGLLAVGAMGAARRRFRRSRSN